jgi:hypothetical protein
LQSTIINCKKTKETGRSAGEIEPEAISLLLDKTIWDTPMAARICLAFRYLVHDNYTKFLSGMFDLVEKIAFAALEQRLARRLLIEADIPLCNVRDQGT